MPPYHEEPEQEIHLPDGQRLLLRPVRPDDRDAYVRLFQTLPPEDIYMRFLSPMKTLPDDLATRLTQIDCQREMALVLVDKDCSGETVLLGAVRFCADAENERAEFAILLRHDMTGMGLGPMMMRRMIECARRRGIKEIFGEVLQDNNRMLKLCGAMGFSLHRMADEPGVILASLAL